MVAESEIRKDKPAINYICSRCGKQAEIKDSIVIRTCKHEKESIIANISAVCKGLGKA